MSYVIRGDGNKLLHRLSTIVQGDAASNLPLQTSGVLCWVLMVRELYALWVAFGYVIINVVVCILVVTHTMLYQRLTILEAPVAGWNPTLIWPIALGSEHMGLSMLYQRLMILEAPATGWHPALIWPIARIGEHMRLFVLE
jgi:hypothetical protein